MIKINLWRNYVMTVRWKIVQRFCSLKCFVMLNLFKEGNNNCNKCSHKKMHCQRGVFSGCCCNLIFMNWLKSRTLLSRWRKNLLIDNFLFSSKSIYTQIHANYSTSSVLQFITLIPIKPARSHSNDGVFLLKKKTIIYAVQISVCMLINEL